MDTSYDGWDKLISIFSNTIDEKKEWPLRATCILLFYDSKLAETSRYSSFFWRRNWL
jgi:hypothetical protein